MMAVSFTITPATRIGWIGTGVMGLPMLQHVASSLMLGSGVNSNSNGGYRPCIVMNRSRSKAAPLQQSVNAKIVDSVAEVARQADIVFTMLGYPSDVRSVYFDQNGLLETLAPGTVVVDMTSSEPYLAQQIAQEAEKRGIYAIDAPVSGGDVGAREARLSIMVGGKHEVMYAIMPLLQAMGKTIVYCGKAGAGQHTKMTNQILIASNMVGVCEGLLYAHRAGLDLSTAISAVAAGAAGSWSISNLGPRIVRRDFAPGFIVDHFIKDMGIALNEAARMKIALPGLALARQLYGALQAQGDGQKGTQALALALERLNGLEVSNDRPMKADFVQATEEHQKSKPGNST